MNKDKALRFLKAQASYLTKQQYKTIKGQIICGDVTGALKGLKKILVGSSFLCVVSTNIPCVSCVVSVYK